VSFEVILERHRFRVSAGDFCTDKVPSMNLVIEDEIAMELDPILAANRRDKSYLTPIIAAIEGVALEVGIELAAFSEVTIVEIARSARPRSRAAHDLLAAAPTDPAATACGTKRVAALLAPGGR